MTNVTRTTNPLHFEDLEPKRFEDLVRQLAYDFKQWRRLEATGRSGTDDGFDARGYEIQANSKSASEDVVDNNEIEDDVSDDRLWLIQCKREKSITPAKMRTHLKDIVLSPHEPLYGIIFAAACGFSKKTRDVLADWCRDNGISEWHVWGKAELEDQLLQPKNDNLLFAYFGFSFTIRRRSLVSEMRRRIAIKKKLLKIFKDRYIGTVLIRDIESDQYPDHTPGESVRWRVREVQQVTAWGLLIRLFMQPAWISTDGKEWDAALGVDGQDLDNGQDHWHEQSDQDREQNSEALAIWGSLPEEERAWKYTDVILPFGDILLVDEDGDDAFDGPHIFVTGWEKSYPRGRAYVESIKRPTREIPLNRGGETEGRVSKFPEHLRHRKLDLSSF